MKIKSRYMMLFVCIVFAASILTGHFLMKPEAPGGSNNRSGNYYTNNSMLKGEMAVMPSSTGITKQSQKQAPVRIESKKDDGIPGNARSGKKISGGVPVLTYHCIDYNVFGVKEIFLSPALFDKQMKYLSDNGYTPVTFADLDNADNINKPVMITFDDGYENNYTYAFPILKKYNFKATIFLITGAIDRKRYLTKAEIDRMKGLIDFEAHTVTHCLLTQADTQKLEFELGQSKRELEALLGRRVCATAYPFGKCDARVINITKKYFRYAVTTRHGSFYPRAGNDFEIKRKIISKDTGIEQFKLQLSIN